MLRALKQDVTVGGLYSCPMEAVGSQLTGFSLKQPFPRREHAR
jgi:hypothetical protein